MLTIQNIHKLRNQPLGKKNWYVKNIREMFDLEPKIIRQTNQRYKIDITNRQFSITITLDRKPFEINYANVYLLSSSTGYNFYASKTDISNMDRFIDKLRLVGLKNV